MAATTGSARTVPILSSARAAADLARAGQTFRYGDHRDQVCDLRLPRGDGPHPVVALLHGGSWGGRWTRHTVRPVAGALVRAGWATWNVEYRRVDRGGGWPGTLQDVGAGIDLLAETGAPVDLERVVLLGHSAGGQLALFAASRPRLPKGFPGAGPRQPVTAVVALAPVTSLFPGARRLLGADRDQEPERWRLADPSRTLPLGVPALVVHGTEDRIISLGASRRYVDAARTAGDRIDLEVLPGLGHAAVIDPRGPAWPAIEHWLADQRATS